MTKLILCLFLFSPALFAESLSTEEQKKLLEENKALKEEVKFLKEEIIKAKTTKAPPPQDSAKMMEVLQKGKRYQEEQNQALEELDKED